MKSMLAVLLMLAAPVVFAAAPPPVAPLLNGAPVAPAGSEIRIRGMKPPTKFNFNSLSVSEVISLVYTEVLTQSYVIDPTVIGDSRTVSFRYDGNGEFRTFWIAFLDSLGLAVAVRNGVDFVIQKKPDPAKAEPEKEIFVYRTKYRPLSYLVDVLSPLVTSSGFAGNRSVRAMGGDKTPVGANPPAPTGSAASMIDQDGDTLIFQGSKSDIAKLEKLLPQIDVAVGQVLIKAVVYEVTTGKNDGTAFSLAVGLLGGKVGVRVGSASDLSNALTLKTGSIDAAFSALASDSRFKVVSTPSVRARSGTQARLTVGQDVPTVGAVTVPQGGSPAVQSVDYRSSGVILGVSPTVRQSGIDIVIDQQISDFARTETGVNNSPTLSKRSLSASVTLDDGELVVLGGLTQDRNTSSTSGLSFFPKFMRTSADTDTRTEILLLMQVTKLGL